MHSLGRGLWVSLLLAAGTLAVHGQNGAGDAGDLIRQGEQALEQNQLHDAAQAFQKALDINPSSAKAHVGLGVALAKEMMAGNARPSEDSDLVERAEGHLRQATELAPSSLRPLLQYSELETFLADRSPDQAEKETRYGTAQEMLKRVVALEPGRADLYLKLATLERDEFGPAIEQAKAMFSKNKGPIPVGHVRRDLQDRYGGLMDDAISNAETAAKLDGHAAKPLLLVARLLRQRAVIRDTQQDYAADLHTADDWEAQFLAVGGHLEQGEAGLK